MPSLDKENEYTPHELYHFIYKKTRSVNTNTCMIKASLLLSQEHVYVKNLTDVSKST